MQSLPQKIMKRVRGHGRGKRVYTPKDFLDLGSRDAVDQALARLVKGGRLRRLGRGLYDCPRNSLVLDRPVPPSPADLVDALVRRGIRIMPDGIVAANGLGLTNAVPAKASYVTDGPTRTLRVGGRTIRLRHARRQLMNWAGRPGAPVVQALDWLGRDAASDPHVIAQLRNRLPDSVKRDLRNGVSHLPDWLASIVKQIVARPQTATT